MLRQVGFADPERILRAYPHELSGGQRQRVAIAQALICRPNLLIADEPLSALDAATQAEILELLQRLKRDLGLAMLFITHNAGALAALADNIIVMREGEAVTRGKMEKLQASPDEYVQGILFPEKSLANADYAERSIVSGAPLLEIRGLSKSLSRSACCRAKSLPCSRWTELIWHCKPARQWLCWEGPGQGSQRWRGALRVLRRRIQARFCCKEIPSPSRKE